MLLGRRRVFFVGNRYGKQFLFPNPIFNGEGQQFKTVWDAIGDLPSLTNGQEINYYTSKPKNDFQKILRNKEQILEYHKSPNHSDIMIKRMRKIKQGHNHSSLPSGLQLKSGYPNIYGRLEQHEPAGTITGNCGCISAPGKFIHPIDNRAITVREAARLQSFNDTTKFVGSQNSKYKQVGNSVPPLLAEALAIQIKSFLLNKGN